MTRVLAAEAVSRTVNGRRLVDDASLKIDAGELVGLIGPNGAGKSTLLSLLAGLADGGAHSGTVRLGVEPLTALTPRERARRIGWLEQAGQVHWPVTVERLVALGRLPHLAGLQRPGEADAVAIDAALAATDCLALRDRAVTTLSGGERTRALLARVLAGEPGLILADEPCAALDPAHQLDAMALLRDFATGDRASLVVLHDLSHAARWCDRLYLMQAGRIVAEGPPRAVLTDERLRAVYGIEAIGGETPVPWLVPTHRVSGSS